jgi:4-amino-4-deoxy-L-arabinose transferase-like glycosyltransferase
VKAAWMAWMGAFFVFFCTAHGNLESLDSTATMHAAKALWMRGDSGLLRQDQGAQWLGEWALSGYIQQQASEGKHTYGKVGTNGRTYVWFPIGHVWLMVPLVAVGEALQNAFPVFEERYRELVAPGVPDERLVGNQSYRDGHLVLDHALVAMLLPPFFGATSVLLLFLIARALGAASRDAAWSALAITLGTQLFPLGNETLSDGPGMCFLLAALLATVRAHVGTASPRTLVLGGLAAGAAVLTRYPHALIVPVFGLAIALASWRRRRPLDLLWFALGGLPCLALLLGIDFLRFGDPSDTGYPKFGSWFNYPLVYGLTKLLFAAGKGTLWLSPMLWFALPLGVKKARVPQLRWLAWVLFAIPMAMFSMTNGWQSGQCWGARYVTPGIVGLCAIVLPQARPWARHRRLFFVLFTIGCLVNFTSVLAPTRGHNQLAGQAVDAMYDRELAAGKITQADRDGVDEADHFFFLPRFSPLHANWTYAWKSWRGDFERPDGRPNDGSANTIEPLFGITAMPGKEVPQGSAPIHWEDRGGRHLWWVFWGAMLGVPSLLLLLPALLLAVGLSFVGWRRLLAD